MGERGLVITLPAQVSTTGLSVPSQFDAQELRSWLLHWDRLEFPIGGILRPPPSAEELFLVDAGVMQRTLADPAYLHTDKAHPNDRGYYLSTIGTFRALDIGEPGKWALGYSKFNTRHPRQPSFAFRSDVREDSGFFEDDDDDAGRALLCRLIASLPVPTEDVALEDILEFRQRRRPELLALRFHLEDMAQAVQSAPDKPLAENTAMDRLQASVGDVLKSSQASPLKFRLVDLDWRLNLLPLAGALVAPQVVKLDSIGGLALSTAIAALSIGPSVGLRERREKNTPFEYVVSSSRELSR